MIEEKIAALISDYSNKTLSKKDYQYLQRWLAESPHNEQVFKQQLKRVQDIRQWGFITGWEERAAWERLSARFRPHKRTRTVRVYGGIAASLLIGIASLWLVYNISGNRPALREGGIPNLAAGHAHAVLTVSGGREIDIRADKALDLRETDGTLVVADSSATLTYVSDDGSREAVYHTLAVPRGGEFHLVLADGTQVWLNSDSKFRYPTQFTGTSREVFIEGEAYLDVAPDAAQPFVVHAREVAVEVLGTSFNVTAYAENPAVITTLVTGRVAVTSRQQRMEIGPGRQITALPDGDMRQKEVDVTLYTSWVKGVFEFEELPLAEICQRLSRWYDVSFVFEDDACRDRKFTGGVRKYVSLPEFLQVIERTTDVVFESSDNRVIVRKK